MNVDRLGLATEPDTVPAIQASPRGLSVTRPLKVHELPSDGVRFCEELSKAQLTHLLKDRSPRGSGLRFAPEEAAIVDIEVVPSTGPNPATGVSTTDRPKIRIRGNIKLDLTSTCVRCLESLRLTLTAPVEMTLHPEQDPLTGVGLTNGKADLEDAQLEAWDEENFPHPDALDEDVYDGNTLVLFDVLQEAILLGLPTSPTCEEKTACDQRTQQLIDEANAAVQASDAEGDPRWAALRALKHDLNAANRGGGKGKN